MRGTKVVFNEVAPTIPSKEKIHVVELKISIQIFERKKSATRII
jgi:hypothetical protein